MISANIGIGFVLLLHKLHIYTAVVGNYPDRLAITAVAVISGRQITFIEKKVVFWYCADMMLFTARPLSELSSYIVCQLLLTHSSEGLRETAEG